jgi:hypothetical protein
MGHLPTKAAKKEAELAKISKNFQDSSTKAAKNRVLKRGWPVYQNFEIEESDSDIHVYAPREAPEIPSKRGVQTIHSAWMAEDLNRVRVYAPLRDTPDLFLKFASLGRKGGVTRDEASEAMLDWVETHGALGLEDDEGRGESLVGFSRAVSKAAQCLELYEAATAEIGVRDDPDVEILDSYQAYGVTPREKREWAMQEVARIVGKYVEDECHPQLYRQVNTETGRTVGFEQGWGFRSLIGAMYLQMMWLMTDGGESLRCKGPGCNRIIRIGRYKSGDAKHVGEFKLHNGGRPPRYKTRKDKEFCSRNCKEKWRYHYVIKPRKLTT